MAALRLYEWSKNVSQDDGSWSNDLDPSSWRGTTVFGAIALAEALHHHGDLLSETDRSEWAVRLAQAADGYLRETFTAIDITNINYGVSAVYAFDLIGRVLNRPDLRSRARSLVDQIAPFFTEPNRLLSGEGKPARNVSGRGLPPVDLGYNVEESLNAAVLYALANDDDRLASLLTVSLRRHLEFMLPDGGWDNSWGTRQFKWTYWGSRTTDGCQPAYLAMADRDPAFALAAQRNLDLLARTTEGGLLYGGLHYTTRGIPACIHHTFAHAKALAFVVDSGLDANLTNNDEALPREAADGVREFTEIAVWLAARGPWRATVSAYDGSYLAEARHDDVLHTMGGALGVLHHERLGLLTASSMPRYVLYEPRNQQPNPDEDVALTPRVELITGGHWFTHLYDPSSRVEWTDDGGTITVRVRTTLLAADGCAPPGGHADVDLLYQFADDALTVRASCGPLSASSSPALVVPIVSPTGEDLHQVSERRIEIEKSGGTLIVESNGAMTVADRVFNMVPGVEALPLRVAMDGAEDRVVEVHVRARSH
ncbi:hypothetical protein [Microbacterium xanthum]|uniref:hypothetical protein n=1 Tax=Microbacterium xanthum TaxID=3079794 RepID=UPI002AD4D326|nr:hypothetical protein [Microbacterium sp. KSW-48]MDZ8171161.1 hypothetical protein [Microbacterium sp. KSW-48]